MVAESHGVARQGRSVFFVAMALFAAAVAILGFSPTFFLPLSRGAFSAPPVVFWHGGFAFAWIALFLLQPSLIRLDRYDIHRLTGALGALVALGVAVTGVGVGLFAVERDLAAGLGDTAVSALVGVYTSMAMFLGLVVAAVLMRGRPETHKRLMLLATIVVLWPAWFRIRHYFPGVPRPDLWFALVAADSLILVAMLRDRLAFGRVHPVLLWVGPAIIAEQTLEALMFDSPAWRVLAGWLYGLF